MLKNLLKSNYLLPIFSFSLAISLRLVFIFLPAHPYDAATFEAWGSGVNELGSRLFYEKIWTDYLPLPIYFFGFIKKIADLFGQSFELILKLSLSLIELVIIATIYQQKKFRKASLLLLLSPALALNGPWWGQIDGMVALFLLLSLTTLKSKPTLSAISFAISVATKPIGILTLPFVLLQLKKVGGIIFFGVISSAVFFLTSLPVVFGRASPLELLFSSVSFMWDRVIYQASMYPYTTINAFNFWSLRGSNWLPDTNPILGISPHFLGLAIFLISSVFLLKQTLRQKSPNYFLLVSVSLLMFYSFATRMHERHMLYGLVFLAAALPTAKSFRNHYLALTIVYAVNVWAAFTWVMRGQFWPITESARVFFSFLTVFSTASMFTKLSGVKLKLTISRRLLITPLILILLFAFLLRTLSLKYPPTMMFDEVYHAFTAQEIVRNNPAAWEWWNTPPPGYAYEWTHPPFAKYAMVLGILLFGKNALGWRIGSALAGTLSVYLIYLLTKKILNKKKTALIAAFIISIEGLHLVQSRIAMNDIYLLLFILLSLYLALCGKWKKSSLALGFALSSKWSAVFLLIPLFYLYLRSAPANPRRTLGFLRVPAISLVTYLILYTPFFFSGHTLEQYLELHRQMWYYHTHLIATHSYESGPLAWISAARPVWYYVNYQGNYISNIYALVNPLVAWFGLISMLLAVWKKPATFTPLLLTYLAFLIPWIASPRIMFMYHYLPSSALLAIPLAFTISSQPARFRKYFILVLTLSFIALSPLYFGFPAHSRYWDTLFRLFPTWK